MYSTSTKKHLTEKKKKLTLSDLITYIEIIVIVFVLFSYPGLLNDKKMYFFEILFFIEIFNYLTVWRESDKKYVKQTSVILILYLISFLIQIITKNNLQRPFEYLFVSLTCFQVSYRFINLIFTLNILSFVKIFSRIFVIGTFINVFMPTFFGKYMPFLYGSGIEMINCANQGFYIGFAGEPSFNAYVATISLIFATIDLVMKRRKPSDLLWLALSIIAVALTGKRSFLLISPLLIIAIIRWANKKKKYEKTLLAVFAMLVIVFLIYVINPNMFSFMDRMFNSDNSINLNYRDIIWGIALTLFWKNPFIGIGINQFDYYFSGYYQTYFSYYEPRYFAGAHNSYIQFLSELGIIGCLILSYFVANMYINSRKKLNKIQSFNVEKSILLFSMAVQLLTLIYAISGNPMHQYQQLAMYIFALGMSFIKIDEINWEVN